MERALKEKLMLDDNVVPDRTPDSEESGELVLEEPHEQTQRVLRPRRYNSVAAHCICTDQMVALPLRYEHNHHIPLSSKENEIYQQLLTISRKVLEDYIKNMEGKSGNEILNNPSALATFAEDKKIATLAKEKQKVLVLLLRLRQVCSHPALIKTMLDANDAEDLASEDATIEEDDVEFFTNTNPLFDKKIVSSKMKFIASEVEKIVHFGEKAVVVSQWPLMLQLFKKHFNKLNIKCHMITGNVRLKQIIESVKDFNNNREGNPVMLITLGAGEVDLNLIGANHLFVVDVHWNPQLEAQACDRIYRVGQEKDVHVHRILTNGTVEEKILMVQKNKLKMTNGILTGAAKLVTRGLTLDDLKMIYNVPQTS